MTSAISTLAPRARRRMEPPAPPDPVTGYALDVVAGRVVAGVLVRKACERHLRDLATGSERGLRFDPDVAAQAIGFFGLLRHYKGEWGPRPGKPLGDPILLAAWQKFLVGAAFGWLRADGTRRFRSVYVEIAKKNGKTLIAAVIGILLAFFDREPAAEVYSVATKRDQAKLSWSDAWQMVRRNPELAKRLETLALTITDLKTASFFRPLGRDSDSDQGINPHGAIVDELHVLADRDSIDNIETATSARRQPMVWKITTAGVKRESVWAEERRDAVAVVEGRATDDSMLVLIYTLDEGDDPFDEAVWPKANPNLGVSVNLDTLRQQAEVAKRSPGKLGAYLRFRMNVPTQVSTRWLPMADWDDPECQAEPDETPGRSGFAGLDLASVRDLTAFILALPNDDGYDLVCRFWCPEEGIELRSRRDAVPYEDWVRDGYLIATPGNVTDYDEVEKEILALAERFDIGEIAFDRWNATALISRLQNAGARCVAISQNYTGLSAASKELEKLVVGHKIRHGRNPVLRWMADNVEIETDASENIRPSKAKSTERIDGIVATVMGIGAAMRNSGEALVWTAV